MKTSTFSTPLPLLRPLRPGFFSSRDYASAWQATDKMKSGCFADDENKSPLIGD
jgi:hypothetical protein